MTKKLIKYADFTRKEVHDIFDPTSNFLPQRGTWGFQGIIPIPSHKNDFVFFVTFGRVEGHHTFDEEITNDGVLSWQSQPKQKISDNKIQSFINHDQDKNNIYLFLRTDRRNPSYTYLGKLAYISHDAEREQPVYFKWQILDWELTEEQANRIGLILKPSLPIANANANPGSVMVIDPPPRSSIRRGENTNQFRGRHVNFDQNNRANKKLGNLGEILILNLEKEYLINNGKPELAELVDHTSETEGDGTGYDIKSFSLEGKVKYIEVKTTRAGSNTPFYFTIRELLFSKQHPETYYLYRVFGYDETSNSGNMYVLKGDMEQLLNLEPITFKATNK